MVSLIPENAVWRKSSYSGGNGTCVEVGFAPAAVAVRDTKDREGGMLAVLPDRWSNFLADLKQGTFDRH
ncbi:DUF397 domain-containing protein [Haloactinomyces albus]|uniref:DUF397 domain-containing protein n=1 Tax=Haloactinomyces albus TaxID=1352928 RepID=A0AAE4CLC6_9ACTN|nr:DUF397 domain-containing protein [Haloactinomyces albus]MDR7301211.1 hypothetical protein [Haloactinomyces albus]